MKVYQAINEYNFRKIDCYPSYMFSECGQILSLRSNKFLKPLNTKNGYQHVVLVEDKIKYRHAVHRLIARAFHGDRGIGFVVNHIDGNKKNNSAENIEWVTQSENVKHSYSLGLRIIDAEHKKRAADLGRSRRTVSDEVIQKMKSMFSGYRGDIERISKELGVSRYVVSYHINGDKK